MARHSPFKGSWLVGKTIASVSASSGRHRGTMRHNLRAITFTDGAVVWFTVGERDDGEYDVMPSYRGRRPKSGGVR
jgi:hypothetical protein